MLTRTKLTFEHYVDTGATLSLVADPITNAVELELSKASSELERSFQDRDTLIKINKIATNKIEEGTGLSLASVKIASILVGAIRKKHEPSFMQPNFIDTTFPSFESFENKQMHLMSTEIALEGIKSFISVIVDKIIGLLKKIRDYIVSFFTDHGHRVKYLEDKLDRTKLKIEAIPVGSLRSVKIKATDLVGLEDNTQLLRSIAQHLRLGFKNKCDFESIKMIINNTQTTIDLNIHTGNMIARAMQDMINDPRDFSKIANNADQILHYFKTGLHHVHHVKKEMKDNKTINKYGPFYNHKELVVEEQHGKSHTNECPRLFNAKAYYERTGDSPVEYIETLSDDQLRKLFNVVRNMLERFVPYEKTARIIEKALGKTESFLENNREKFSTDHNSHAEIILTYIKDLTMFATKNMITLANDSWQIMNDAELYMDMSRKAA